MGHFAGGPEYVLRPRGLNLDRANSVGSQTSPCPRRASHSGYDSEHTFSNSWNWRNGLLARSGELPSSALRWTVSALPVEAPGDKHWAKKRTAAHEPGIETIRRWLSNGAMADRPIKFHGFSATMDPATELPLKWLSDLTTKFWQSNQSMLFITGGAGTGKTSCVRSILDRSKGRYSRRAKVLYFSVGTSSPLFDSRLSVFPN